MKLKCLKDINGIVERKEGNILEYIPWNYDWQLMTEPERVEKGLYVHCYGQGEFETLRISEDVERID